MKMFGPTPPLMTATPQISSEISLFKTRSAMVFPPPAVLSYYTQVPLFMRYMLALDSCEHTTRSSCSRRRRSHRKERRPLSSR
jgi:hypothetical protein